MKRLLLASTLLIISIEPAFSGPDETTQHLMNDPVSMLDLGVLKAEIALRNQDLGSMRFQWDVNRFYILKWMYGGDFSDENSAEQACASWVKKVREMGGINLETGEAMFSFSTFAEGFSHDGFARGNEPKNLYTNLDQLFVLKCHVRGSLFVGSPSVSVTAPLLGTSYSLEKK